MTQEKKQTAVEWLINELVKKGFPIEKHGIDLYQQALAMEKEQMRSCFWEIDIQTFEQYYKEMYGKE